MVMAFRENFWRPAACGFSAALLFASGLVSAASVSGPHVAGVDKTGVARVSIDADAEQAEVILRGWACGIDQSRNFRAARRDIPEMARATLVLDGLVKQSGEMDVGEVVKRTRALSMLEAELEAGQFIDDAGQAFSLDVIAAYSLKKDVAERAGQLKSQGFAKFFGIESADNSNRVAVVPGEAMIRKLRGCVELEQLAALEAQWLAAHEDLEQALEQFNPRYRQAVDRAERARLAGQQNAQLNGQGGAR